MECASTRRKSSLFLLCTFEHKEYKAKATVPGMGDSLVKLFVLQD